MKLYQQAGVNPLIGVGLPVVLQLPMFFALFKRAEGDRRVEAGPPAPVRAGRCRWCKARGRPKILGVHVADKFLFTGTIHVPMHAKIVILLTVIVSMITTYLTVRQSMKRGIDARGDPRQPDGPVAEIHDVHHAFLRAVGPVLAVRAGPVLGDHETCGRLGSSGCCSRGGRSPPPPLAAPRRRRHRRSRRARPGARRTPRGSARTPARANLARWRTSHDQPRDVRDQSSTNGASRKRGNGGQPRSGGRRPGGSAAGGFVSR